MEDLSCHFPQVKAKLCELLSKSVYDVWMTELTLVRFNEEEVVLDLPEFKRRISEKKFLPQLHEAVESTIGFDVEINLISAETPIVPTSAVQDDLPQRTHLPRGHEANTFDTFVVGSSNRYPHAAASWVAENPGKGYNPLMIYGNAGLGKTHLLSAIFHEIKRRMPNASIIFTTGESFANEIIAAIRDNAMTMVHEKYRTADVFLVDDVQFIAGKERTQEEFFHTFNILVQNARQIVLTADKPPKDIPGLEDRLVSRFNVGLLADIQPPDLETRMVIVKKKADSIGLHLPDDVVDYFVRTLKNNIRQLEGVVNQLQAMVEFRGLSVNLATAQQAANDLLSEERPVSVTVERVIEETARNYQLTISELRSKRRSAEISRARQVAMYVISQTTGLPTKAIGNEFDRDHSTVVYALREIREALAYDSSLRKAVQEITKAAQEN